MQVFEQSLFLFVPKTVGKKEKKWGQKNSENKSYG